MKKELLLSKLQGFDPEIFAILQDEIQRQRYMLSLITCAVIIPMVWPF